MGLAAFLASYLSTFEAGLRSSDLLFLPESSSLPHPCVSTSLAPCQRGRGGGDLFTGLSLTQQAFPFHGGLPPLLKMAQLASGLQMPSPDLALPKPCRPMVFHVCLQGRERVRKDPGCSPIRLPGTSGSPLSWALASHIGTEESPPNMLLKDSSKVHSIS